MKVWDCEVTVEATAKTVAHFRATQLLLSSKCFHRRNQTTHIIDHNLQLCNAMKDLDLTTCRVLNADEFDVL